MFTYVYVNIESATNRNRSVCDNKIHRESVQEEEKEQDKRKVNKQTIVKYEVS